MKYKIISLMIINICVQQLSLYADGQTNPTQILYPDRKGYHPGYLEEKHYEFDKAQAIPFTPANMATTEIDDQSNDANIIGYFWDSKNNDSSLLYPGKARIGNDQYINVVAVDSSHVNNNETDPNSITTIMTENVFNIKPTNANFNINSLVYLGSFMKKNDPIVYSVYGQYYMTIVPDPVIVSVTGPNAVSLATP